MLSNRERSELVAMIDRAKLCLANNSLSPAEAYYLQEHGETLVELERMRRFPAYSPALQGCEA